MDKEIDEWQAAALSGLELTIKRFRMGVDTWNDVVDCAEMVVSIRENIRTIRERNYA